MNRTAPTGAAAPRDRQLAGGSRPPPRQRSLLVGAVLVWGLALSLPSCRAASRWNIFRMTPSASECDTANLGDDAAMNDPNLVWNCTCEGLDEDLLSALRLVAADYAAECGQALIVNSGARSLQRQAELMSEMSQSQLEGMYCRQGYPGYIRSIVNARKAGSGTVDAQQTYAILRDRDDGFISAHLSGAAVDLSPVGADVALLRKLLDEHGFIALDERGLGVNCLHATYRDAPRRIVRE